MSMLAQSLTWLIKSAAVVLAAAVIGAGVCFLSDLGGRPLCGCFFSDFRDAHFATYEDLRSDRNVRGPLFPEIVPRDAREIAHAASLDTGDQVVAFSLSAEQLVEYERSLVPEQAFAPRPVEWCLRWWPRSLQPEYINLQDSALSFFYAPNTDFHLIIDRVANRVYAWEETP